MHHAKRTEYVGCYTYRGYIVENNGTCWVIGKGVPTNYSALDAMNTKRDALEKIDSWLDK
jgi:hypothetical protein